MHTSQSITSWIKHFSAVKMTGGGTWSHSIVLLVALFACGCVDEACGQSPTKGKDGWETVSPTDAALRMLSQQFAANYGKLQTWTGTFRFDDSMTHSGGGANAISQIAGGKDDANEKLVKIDSGTGEFAVDVESNSVFTAFAIDKSIVQSPRGGGETVLATAVAERTVVAGDRYLHMEPDRIHGEIQGLGNWSVKSGRVAFRDPARESRREADGSIINPLKFYCLGGDLTYGEYFQTFAENLAAGKFAADIKAQFAVETKVANGGSEFRVRIAKHQEFDISSAAGFNPTAIRQKTIDGVRLEAVRELEYANQEGVFIPCRMELKLFEDDGMTVKFRRTWTLVESEVNKLLAADTFSYKQLGLKNGERVVDRVDGVGYVYRDGELVDGKRFDLEPEPAEPQRAASNEDEQSGRWHYLIGLNLLGVFVITAVYIVRKRFSM